MIYKLLNTTTPHPRHLFDVGPSFLDADEVAVGVPPGVLLPQVVGSLQVVQTAIAVEAADVVGQACMGGGRCARLYAAVHRM